MSYKCCRNSGAVAALTAVLLVFGACQRAEYQPDAQLQDGGDVEQSTDSAADAAADADADADMQDWSEHSFSASIAELIGSHCATCHSETGMASFSLTDRADVEAYGPSIVDSVVSRRMPPWLPDDGCRPMVHERRLDEETIGQFVAWRDAGYPMGDPRVTQVPAPAADPLAEAPSLTVNAVRSVEFPDTEIDVYDCVLADFRFEEDTWLRAAGVRSDIPGIMHHATLIIVSPEDMDQAEGTHCEDVSRHISSFVGGFAPGSGATHLPEDTAYFVQAGSGIAIDLHYSLANADGVERDRAVVDLWTRDTAPAFRAFGAPATNLDFTIPAFDAEYLVHGNGTVPASGELIGVIPHMHLRATETAAWLIHEDGSYECLYSIPRWDFEWQQIYHFRPDSVVPLSPGDRTSLRCVYDNSQANQPIVNGEQWPAGPVESGPSTYQEMCTVGLIVRYPHTQ